MYNSTYKYFKNAATLATHLFPCLQVYLFSGHSVYYSSLRTISARLCQHCSGGGPEGRVGGWSFSGSVQPWASLHRLWSTPLIRALDREPDLHWVHLFAKPLTQGTSTQAGAHYFHVVQPELILELWVQENEMQKAELLLLGTAPCKCGQAASRPRVARGCCTVWPSQLKPLSAICALHN